MTDKTLAEWLAPMTTAEIDAMTDDEVATLMGGRADDVSTPEDRRYMRDAAKAATEAYAEEVLARSQPVRPEEAERYRQLARGGRPPLGAGESVQVRARLSPDLAALLDLAVAKTGRSRSEIVRDALEEHLGRWAAEVSAREGKAVVTDLYAALDARLSRAQAAAERGSEQPAKPKGVGAAG